MKKLLALLFLCVNLSVFAQFPAPSDLTYSLQYNIGMWGVVCNGENLPEYGYCSTFSWLPADTLSTSADFIHYCLYMVDLNNTNDTVVLAITEQTLIEIPFGLFGYVRVTAVYTNPDGESEPTNWVYNEYLPILIQEAHETKPIFLVKLNTSKIFRLQNYDLVEYIRIIDMTGTPVMEINNISKEIQLNVASGIYIAEILGNNKKTICQKIVL